MRTTRVSSPIAAAVSVLAMLPVTGATATLAVFASGFEDVQTVVLDATSLAINESGQGSFGARLLLPPSAPVVLTVSSDDPAAVTATPAELVFSPADYAVFQTVTVAGVDDVDANEEIVAVWLESEGTIPQFTTVTVHDDDGSVLTVSVTGFGTVESADGTIDCPGACSTVYPVGATVSLNAIEGYTSPADDAAFAGWNGACSGVGSCALVMDAARTVGARFELAPNLAFVSSTVHTGNVGGIAGADAVCQSRAQAFALPGTYRAYLSSSSEDAISRMAGASGWIRVDGKPIANSAADLAAGRIFYPLRLSESGVDVGNAAIFTATNSDGSLSGPGTCFDYTSATASLSIRSGTPSAQGALFAASSTVACNSNSRLYCLGVDRSAAVGAAISASHRLVFASMATWIPGGGIGSADQLCQSEAEGAGYAGTFSALLAADSASAASRFDPSGPPWARADGVLLAPDGAALLDATYWDAAPGLSADGSEHFGSHFVWSGAPSLTTAGTSASTCDNWTSGSSAGAGRGGLAGQSWIPGLMDAVDRSCDTPGRLICLQQ